MRPKPKGLKTKSALKSTGFRRKDKPNREANENLKPKSPIKARPNGSLNDRSALQKRTIRHIEKTRALIEASNAELTEWEDEFLECVANRVKLYGRAFRDPELGMISGTLSLRQGLKVKQIGDKAKIAQKKVTKKSGLPLG